MRLMDFFNLPNHISISKILRVDASWHNFNDQGH